MSKAIISSLEFVHSEINAALATATNADLFFKVPAAVLPPQAAGVSPFFAAFLDMELRVQPQTAAACQVTLFEAPTTSADGSARTPQCTNRGVFGAVPTSLVTVFSGPTVGGGGTQTGTQLESGYVTVNERWMSKCWLLKPATNYLCRVANLTGSTILTSLTAKLSIVPLKDVLYACYGDS